VYGRKRHIWEHGTDPRPWLIPWWRMHKATLYSLLGPGPVSTVLHELIMGGAPFVRTLPGSSLAFCPDDKVVLEVSG